MGLPILALIPFIGTAFTTIKDLICKFWQSPEDKAKVAQIQAEVKVIEDQVNAKLREHEEFVNQQAIALEEAKNPNTGWRYRLGQVCALAWFVDLVVSPIYNYVISVWFPKIVLLPGLPVDKLDILLWLTASLAGIRMIDKGVALKLNK
jgi:hypothetical protein